MGFRVWGLEQRRSGGGLVTVSWRYSGDGKIDVRGGGFRVLGFKYGGS